jgi:hypothetical protein
MTTKQTLLCEIASAAEAVDHAMRLEFQKLVRLTKSQDTKTMLTNYRSAIGSDIFAMFEEVADSVTVMELMRRARKV